MLPRSLVLSAVVSLVALGSVTMAEDLEPIEPSAAQLYAAHLTEVFLAETKEPQVDFEVDVNAATGWHNGPDGIICVPAKGLAEEPDPAAASETGAGLCYVFMSQCFNPVIDGKPVDEKALRKVKFTDGNGGEQEATCLIMTAKQVSEEDWRLYAFGTDKKPLVESRWSEALENTEGALAMHVNGAKDNKANLVFTVFNKYSASISIGHK